MSAIRFSDRAHRIKPSPTMAVDAKARELAAQGKDVISLGVGEPDFDTPEHIKEAGIKAIRDGITKYTAVDGILSLRKAICGKFARDNGLSYTPDQVLVSVGGKHSFFNLAMALVQTGDEVIIPAPYWPSYLDIVLVTNATPVVVPAGLEQGFKITPAQLEAALTPRTKLVVINSPSNPTGAVYTRAELAALGEVLRRHPQVVIATDDMYEHILWADESFCNILAPCPDLADRTVVLNGVSKAYAMTGWRIGYAAGPKALIAQMKKIQSQSTTNPASMAQVAAETAITADQGCIAPMVRAFRERHDRLIPRINALRGVRCIPSQGAFYIFAAFEEAQANTPGIKDDVQMADYLITEGGVGLVPGSAFGMEGYQRFSFATSMERLDEAVNRLERLLGRR